MPNERHNLKCAMTIALNFTHNKQTKTPDQPVNKVNQLTENQENSQSKASTMWS